MEARVELAKLGSCRQDGRAQMHGCTAQVKAARCRLAGSTEDFWACSQHTMPSMGCSLYVSFVHS